MTRAARGSFLQVATQNADRLGALINDLLDVRRAIVTHPAGSQRADSFSPLLDAPDEFLHLEPVLRQQ